LGAVARARRIHGQPHGNRQKAALVAVLASRAELLLLDERTGAWIR
jgi:energy-coupling factor transporter ATP-binding protein EcfA2